jgi:hypothetical protein
MFIVVRRSGFENSVGVKCASCQIIEACINEMRHVTPTEFENGGSLEFTINISPLAGLVRVHNQSQLTVPFGAKFR